MLCDKSINKINKKKSFFFILSFCISQKWLKKKNYQILSIKKLSVFMKLKTQKELFYKE